MMNNAEKPFLTLFAEDIPLSIYLDGGTRKTAVGEETTDEN